MSRVCDLVNSSCSGVRSVAEQDSVIPKMAFMGVRISWLMFARKSDLVRLESLAISSARRDISFAWTSSVTFDANLTTFMGTPFGPRIGL